MPGKVKLTKADYSENAIARSLQSAEDWLADHDEGFPRTWEQESADDGRRGYQMYEADWEAPPIAGYEVLEALGHVERLELVRGDTRQRFRITPAGRSMLSAEQVER